MQAIDHLSNQDMADGIQQDEPVRPLRQVRGLVNGYYWGTGRRKTAVASVRMTHGDGKFEINGRPLEEYFTEVQDRTAATAPLANVDGLGKFNVFVKALGGGHTGQAGAIRLGVARALLQANPQFEGALRDGGHLTRDARRVERKKYGRKKARRRFQFSKR